MIAKRRLLILAAVLSFCLLSPGPGSADLPPCSERVLADWSDNGRIDRVYALPCYEEAMAALPTDIRDYTNAFDVIDRALTSAVRAKTAVPASEAQAAVPGAETVDASGAVPLPLPLLVLFGLALALLAAGALARVTRAALGRKGSPG